MLPIVEVVPTPLTSREVVSATQKILKEIGQEPVTFKKEQQGFGSNRLQYAIMNECYRMVMVGVMYHVAVTSDIITGTSDIIMLPCRTILDLMSSDLSDQLQDDVMSVDDVDKLVRYGLGLRYAFMGPLETAHLNAEGK